MTFCLSLWMRQSQDKKVAPWIQCATHPLVMHVSVCLLRILHVGCAESKAYFTFLKIPSSFSNSYSLVLKWVTVVTLLRRSSWQIGLLYKQSWRKGPTHTCRRLRRKRTCAFEYSFGNVQACPTAFWKMMFYLIVRV